MPFPWWAMLAVAVVCGAAGAAGRHLQGGAGPRWFAMVAYIVCCAPSLDYLGNGWGGAAQFVGLTALFYLSMTWEQEFASLWAGAIRNCVPLGILAGVTGCLWPLAGALVVFVAMKWAREPHDGFDDPHADWEVVLGLCYGASWGVAPLLRAW